MKSVRRYLASLALVLVVLTGFAPSVLAYVYYATFTIAETDGTSHVMLPVSATVPVQWMSENGILGPDALDMRVETLGGTEYPLMVTANTVWTAAPVPANSNVNLYLTTGSDNLTDFDIITGDGGYVETADNSTLELGNNFNVTFSEGITLTDNATLLDKTGAVSLATDDAGNLTGTIVNGTETSQAAGATAVYLYNGADIRQAQYIASFTGQISSISFQLAKYNSPTGTLYARIRNAGTDAIIATMGSMDVSTLTASPVWYEFSDAGPSISATNIYLSVEYNGGDGTNAVVTDRSTSDLATGNWAHYTSSWVPNASVDLNFKYKLNDNKVVTTTFTPGTEADNVTLRANATNLYLDVNGVNEDSTALGGVSVTNNSANYTLLQGVPYCGAFEMTISGTRQVYYNPNTLIAGTTLPDRQNSYDGIIHWGANPSGISVTLGSLMTTDQPSLVADTDTTPQDVLPDAGVDMGGTTSTALLQGTMFYNLLMVGPLSDASGFSEDQIWVFYGGIFVLFCTVGAAMVSRGHLALSGFAGLVSTWVCYHYTIYPWWVMVFSGIWFVTSLVLERKASL